MGTGLGLAAALAAAWLWMLPPQVEVAHPRIGQAVQAVYGTGNVEATVMMPVAPRIGARLTALYADEGSDVTAGQVLAQLEDDDLANTVRQLEAQEAFARSDFERDARLLKSGAIARVTYERALSDWKAAQAQTAAAGAQVHFMKLVAPAAGRIIERDGEIGQLIAANQALFWLSCDSPPRISAEVDEEDIARVRPGQDVLIHADAFPKMAFQGWVQSVTPKGDPVARSYRVRIGLPRNSPLMIGMTVETNIVIRRSKQALLLPANAVEGGSVWRLRDGKVESVHVEVGARGASQTEILSGIARQDLVVVAHDTVLTAGEAVRSWQRPSS